LAVTYGWRFALQVPAMAAVVFAAIIPFCAWDKPSDVDYEDEVTMFGEYFCYLVMSHLPM